jgi:hypothetical protein
VFKALYKEAQSEHGILLLPTEMHWLLRGKVLTKGFELQDLITMFLCEMGSILLQHFIDPNLVISLAYLADVIGILNLLRHFTAGYRSDNFGGQRKDLVLSRKVCSLGNDE